MAYVCLTDVWSLGGRTYTDSTNLFVCVTFLCSTVFSDLDSNVTLVFDPYQLHYNLETWCSTEEQLSTWSLFWILPTKVGIYFNCSQPSPSLDDLKWLFQGRSRSLWMWWVLESVSSSELSFFFTIIRSSCHEARFRSQCTHWVILSTTVIDWWIICTLVWAQRHPPLPSRDLVWLQIV